MSDETMVLGLDLGQAAEYSALSVIAREQPPNPEYDGFEAAYARRYRPKGFKKYDKRPYLPVKHRVVHLERWPLGTSYPQVIREVRAMLGDLEGSRTVLALDATGVGRPVYDSFREGLSDSQVTLYGILIHGGDHETRADGGLYRVPKRELISRAVELLQRGDLQFARRLKHAKTLKTELENFRMKISIATGHDSYEHWRERDTDDLVLAVCCALWGGEKGSGQVTRLPNLVNRAARL